MMLFAFFSPRCRCLRCRRFHDITAATLLFMPAMLFSSYAFFRHAYVLLLYADISPRVAMLRAMLYRSERTD